jgi:hypothetical protein
MRFSVDPWDPAYGSSMDGDMHDAEVEVICDIELDLAEWRPVSTVDAVAPDAILFVDGVRRLDARTWIEEPGGALHPGVFASYAAGCVRCNGRAEIVDIEVGRGLYSAAPAIDDVATRHGAYRATPAPDARAESLMNEVHHAMSDAEVRAAERARRTSRDLIVLDGPIRKRGHIPDAVGMIKSHQVRYLPFEAERVVGRLGVSDRTPLFRIEGPPFGRYAWYVALPGPRPHAFASVVRCETSGALAARDAADLASMVGAALGRFASEPHKDARAPQNLYPIAGLERDLRHRLGDHQILYRALLEAAA